MGIGSKVLDFLFGKDNNVFDETGRVRHSLPQKKWKNWEQRYQSQPEYNWKSHSGMKAKERKSH